MDIYSCPACGRLAFFRTNFLPQPKKHVPVEPEPTDVDTAAFYVPGTGSWSNARSAARSIPVTMPFAPCAGPGGISPAPGAENGFRQHSRSVPGAATAEMRNKRNRQAAAMETHGRRCFSAQKKHSITYSRVPALFTSRYSRLRSSVGCAAVKPRQSEKSGRWSAGTASRSRISVTGTSAELTGVASSVRVSSSPLSSAYART